MSAVIPTDPGVVSRGNVPTPRLPGGGQQGTKLDTGVTDHTRVGRSASEVLVDEIADHVRLEGMREIYG